MDPMTEPPLTTANPLTTGQATTTTMSGNSGHSHLSQSHHHSSGRKNEQMLSPSGGDAQTTTTTSIVTSKDDEESSDCKSPGQRYVNCFSQHSNNPAQNFTSRNLVTLLIHLRFHVRPRLAGKSHSKWYKPKKEKKNKTKFSLLLIAYYCAVSYDDGHKLHNGNDSGKISF